MMRKVMKAQFRRDLKRRSEGQWFLAIGQMAHRARQEDMARLRMLGSI